MEYINREYTTDASDPSCPTPFSPYEKIEEPFLQMTNLQIEATYWNQGRWDEVEKLDVRVIETSLRVLKEEYPDTLTSMANLVLTYWN